MSNEFIYEFEKSPKKKGTCPSCGHKNQFRYYKGLDRQYGKCERVNNCSFHNKPDAEKVAPQPKMEKKEESKKQIYPEIKRCEDIIKNADSNFHFFCRSLGISSEHLAKWGVGTEKDKTCFIFINGEGKFLNIKFGEYDKKGKRVKGALYSLKQPHEKLKQEYKLCLFGEHLLSKNRSKTVCLVESEKSAVIASWFYKEYDFIACSSAHGLTDEKIPALFNRKIYNLRDADNAGRGLKSAGSIEKQLKRWELEYHAVDLFPERVDGYDIADAIIDGLRPIIPEHIIKPEAKKEKKEKISFLPAGVNQEDFEKFGFFEQDKAFYTITEKYAKRMICGFTMKVLYLIMSKEHPKRIIEIENQYSYKRILDLSTDAFTSVGAFKKSVESVGNFIFEGNDTDLTRLKKKLFQDEKKAKEIRQLGWNESFNFFAFSNGVYNGSFKKTDEYGIVTHGKDMYFLPFMSSLSEEDKVYTNEKKFIHSQPKNPMTFNNWSDLIYKAYGSNGAFGICFFVSSLFRDFIFNQHNCFPMLYCFGRRQSGKTSFTQSYKYPFGLPQESISLENPSSAVGVYRSLARFSNSIIMLDEYKNGLDKKTIGMLKGLYDGYGRTTGKFSNDNQTNTTSPLSSVIVSGQEIPNIDNALFTRVILLEFTDKNRNEKGFNLLKEAEKEGLTSITVEILKYRALIIEHYKDAYRQWIEYFKEELEGYGIEFRMLLNLAMILSPITILIDLELVKVPFTKEKLAEFALDLIKRQNNQINSSNDVSRFWEIFQSLIRTQKFVENVDFKFRDGDLYIRVGNIYNDYMKEYWAIYKTPGLDRTSLDHYLRLDPAFKGITKLRFRASPGADAPSSPTTCFGFKLDKLDIDISSTQPELPEL